MSYLNGSAFVADLGININILRSVNIRDNTSALPMGVPFTRISAGGPPIGVPTGEVIGCLAAGGGRSG